MCLCAVATAHGAMVSGLRQTPKTAYSHTQCKVLINRARFLVVALPLPWYGEAVSWAPPLALGKLDGSHQTREQL